MKYTLRDYPMFSVCGLNCGLCPRYHTKGTSRCPGCAGDGFSEVHPPCGALSCCLRKGLEYCFQCDDFPCKKYDGVDTADSFITHKNQMIDLEKAKRIGIEAYKAELGEKIEILTKLLENYDNGRSKGFFCLAVNLLDINDLRVVMARVANEINTDTLVKEKKTQLLRVISMK